MTTNALQCTSETSAAVIAQQIVTQTNAFVQQVGTVLKDGVPAEGANPAAKSEEIKKMLGPENLRRLEAALAALNGEMD